MSRLTMAVARNSQMQEWLMRRFQAHLAAVLLACASLVLAAPGVAMPIGQGFPPARAHAPALIWKANVTCRTWREGTTQKTMYCLDGWVCAPGDKCEPGPAIREQMEKRKQQLHDAVERMQQQLQAQSRELHKRIRLAQQAPLGTPNNSRAIQTYLPGNNCSTITGLPGPTPPPSGPCATSGPLPRPPTHAIPNRAVASRIYPRLPPGPAPGLLADLDDVLASIGPRVIVADNGPPNANQCEHGTVPNGKGCMPCEQAVQISPSIYAEECKDVLQKPSRVDDPDKHDKPLNKKCVMFDSAQTKDFGSCPKTNERLYAAYVVSKCGPTREFQYKDGQRGTANRDGIRINVCGYPDDAGLTEIRSPNEPP